MDITDKQERDDINRSDTTLPDLDASTSAVRAAATVLQDLIPWGDHDSASGGAGFGPARAACAIERLVARARHERVATTATSTAAGGVAAAEDSGELEGACQPAANLRSSDKLMASAFFGGQHKGEQRVGLIGEDLLAEAAMRIVGQVGPRCSDNSTNIRLIFAAVHRMV